MSQICSVHKFRYVSLFALPIVACFQPHETIGAMSEMRFRARRLIGVSTHRQPGGWLSLDTSQPGKIDVA